MIIMNTTSVILPFHEYERLKNYGELVQNREQFCVVEDPIENISYVVGRDKAIYDIKDKIDKLDQMLIQKSNELHELEYDIGTLQMKQKMFEQSIWYKLYKLFNR